MKAEETFVDRDVKKKDDRPGRVVHVMNTGKTVIVTENANFNPGQPTPCTFSFFEHISKANFDPETHKPVLRLATDAEVHNFSSSVRAKSIQTSNEKIELTDAADPNFAKAVIDSWHDAPDVSRALVLGCERVVNLTAVLAGLAQDKSGETTELRDLVINQYREVANRGK